MLYGGFSNVEQLKSCKITSKYDDDDYIDMDASVVDVVEYVDYFFDKSKSFFGRKPRWLWLK